MRKRNSTNIHPFWKALMDDWPYQEPKKWWLPSFIHNHIAESDDKLPRLVLGARCKVKGHEEMVEMDNSSVVCVVCGNFLRVMNRRKRKLLIKIEKNFKRS